MKNIPDKLRNLIFYCEVGFILSFVIICFILLVLAVIDILTGGLLTGRLF